MATPRRAFKTSNSALGHIGRAGPLHEGTWLKMQR